MPYELLEHTADAKFRATGETLEEAFGSAVQALTALVVDPKLLDEKERQSVTVQSKTLHGLLFDLIDELLFRLDTEHLLARNVECLTIVERNDEYVLDATVVFDDARKFPGNLKAVTYSDMIVQRQPDGSWVLQVVIDI